MKLNRKTQPMIYRRVAIKTSIIEEQERGAQALMDVGIGIFGLAFVVFLFGLLG